MDGMEDRLPSDLDRLGDALARATARDARERARRGERRRRVAAGCVMAVLALTALAPAGLTPSDRSGLALLASSRVVYQPVACDRPRGGTFVAARPCARPGATDVTPDALARRYAVH